MKVRHFAIALLLIQFVGIVTVSAQSPRPVPTQYAAGTPINYVRTWDAMAPEQSETNLITRSLRDVKQTTQYIDGLGRPIQTVMKQGSLITGSNPTDMVSMVEYDEFGREQFKYMPYPEASSNDGTFKVNPFANQAGFYSSINTVINPIAGQGQTFFYGQTQIEASPLNRVEKAMSPGDSWTGGGRGVSMKYWINTVTDDVKIWTVTNSSTIGIFGTYATTTLASGTYPAGELYKNVTVDEHGKQVIEFKDKEGKVILKKVQLTATADDGTGRNYTGWLSTYYIYDELNQLRCVIQPEAVKNLPGNGWSLTTTILNEQCFRYEYDQRGRMILKKVPGAGEVYMVYDARDRLVMTQDANMRNGTVKWLYTKYDILNRPIETGLWDNSTPFTSHLSAAYTSTDYPSLFGSWQSLSITHYDDYAGLPGGLTSSFDGSWATHFNSTYNTSPLYAQQQIANTQIKGMVAWTQTRILGTGSFLYAVTVYDDKGRPIQVKATNQTGGVDIVTTQYSWAGQPLVTVQKQEKAGAPAQITVVVTQYSYDDLGRVTKTEKKQSNTNVSGNAMSAYKIIAEQKYNALGQLKEKKLAPAYNSNAGLETIAYDYNIRGWMLGVNRAYAKDASSSNYFGFDLGYDKTNNGLINNQTYNAAQYNGNITGMVWKSKGDGEKRKYDFSYDAANRLLKADFTQYSGSVFNQTAGVNYDMKIGDGIDVNTAYDANGNIKQMQQWGLKVGGSAQIDNLSYLYQTGSNKLARVTDGITGDNKLGDFKDGTNSGTDDYSYDVNGNLNIDNNKAISSITYNHLNLPSVITVTGKGTITYTYDATGNKQKKETQENNATVNFNGTNYSSTITTTTKYIGGLVYESKAYSNSSLSTLAYTDRLQFISHEEGRIRFKFESNTLAYDYLLKDHLGNVRMVLTDEEQTIYYPAATLEGTFSAPGTAQASSMINYEKQFYNIDNTKVVTESSIASWGTETVANTKLYYNHNGNPPANLSYPAGTSPVHTAGSTKLYKLNATTNRTGLEFVIKVMAGDKVDIFGKSYFLNTSTINNSNSTPLDVLSLMTNLLGSPSNIIAGKGVTASQLNNWNNGLIPSGFFRGTNGETTTIPKAYINYIFLDEQFKYAGGGFSRVGSSGTVKNHWQVDATLQNIAAPKNGYIFVYVSNESNKDVFFDNLQVVHKPGPILEETHYYPFGLTMAGISSKAAGGLENKRKFNGVELSNKDFSDGNGLELYETTYRGYDPQIGRFHQIDPLSDLNLNWSGYTFAQNNPILFSDPFGLDTIRGELPQNYNPKPGDVFINKNGQEAIYSSKDGWVQSQTLNNITVRGGGGSTNTWELLVLLTGFTDTFYGVYDNAYDHNNYTTTKGKIRPLPTGKRMSQQAKIYKQKSSIVKGTGFGISLVSNLLTAIEIRDQYLKGGMSNINPVDAAGLTLGTSGIGANTLSLVGFNGPTISTISNIAGKGSYVLLGFQNMYIALDFVYNQPGINNWRPTTGNTQDDIIMQNEYDSGIYNWTDYFQR